MNKNIKIIVVVTVCALCGLFSRWLSDICIKDRSNGLVNSIKAAQEVIDHRYGDGAFVAGFRRILKDGEKEYYSFHVKIRDLNSTNTVNLLVTVDNVDKRNLVSIQTIEKNFFKVD